MDIIDIGEELGKVATEVKIAFPMFKYLDNRGGVHTMKGMHFKSEIAQRELSDLGREDHAKA